MEKRILETVQTQEKLNIIKAIDEIGPGGANHLYEVTSADGHYTSTIKFQKGPRKDPSSIYGVLDTDLLEIVRDRLKLFQDGPFACEYNAKALEHVKAALEAMNERVEDRIRRNVLGTNEK